MSGKRPAYKVTPVKPTKHALLGLMLAIQDGDDSRAKGSLLRMEQEEVDYLLILTQRLEGLLRERQGKDRKVNTDYGGY